MTPKELAARWRCSVQHVLTLIGNGQLPGFNVASNPHGKKPRWRIAEADVLDFERRRAGVPVELHKTRRHRRPRLSEVVEFFK